MGRRVFTNELATSATSTDLAGNTGIHHPHAGELEIPTTPFLSRQQLNIDGTLTPMPAQDAKLSYEVFCDVCGCPVKSKKELIKKNRRRRCENCFDLER